MNVHKDEYALKGFKPFFGPTSDIVRGAYPMPSHPASINFFFSNPIGSLSFHPIIPKFGVNLHNNIAPKDVEEEFLFFASNFNGSFITKIGKKNRNFEGFWPFSQKVFMCEKWPPWAKFSGPK